MQKALILGCGPTGLLAAHACALNNWDFQVVSKKRKSFLFGSQYLHEPIPGVTDYDDCVRIWYHTKGSPEQYRIKCHGDAWDGEIAKEDFEEEHFGWNIRAMYDKLWMKYGRDVADYEISGDMAQVHAIAKVERADLIISSLPRPLWSRHYSPPGEKFIYSEGWAAGDAPENGTFVPFTTDNDNEIICDGTDDVAWTRLSRVFGYTSCEWPVRSKPPIPGVSKIQRPLRYEPGLGHIPANGMMHIGRYGTWQKGVLTTDAFKDVFKVTE